MHFFFIVSIFVTIVKEIVSLCSIAILLLQIRYLEFMSTLLCYFYLLFACFTDVFKIVKGGLPQNVTSFCFPSNIFVFSPDRCYLIAIIQLY